jgi:hypothetical protein
MIEITMRNNEIVKINGYTESDMFRVIKNLTSSDNPDFFIVDTYEGVAAYRISEIVKMKTV